MDVRIKIKAKQGLFALVWLGNRPLLGNFPSLIPNLGKNLIRMQGEVHDSSTFPVLPSEGQNKAKPSKFGLA